MARQKAGVLIPGLDLGTSDDKHLSAQLFAALRKAVLNGSLEGGTRMPSSRTLAADLGVSRTTVIQAYEQLKSEGYLVGREKSGTFVRDAVPEELHWKPVSSSAGFRNKAPCQARLSDRLKGWNLDKPGGSIEALPLNPGIPAIREFPAQLFARIQKQVTLSLGPSRIARCPAEGAPHLREQVAAYLQSSRGVVCDPSQVFIISGTRQALQLLLMAISNPGDSGWAEDPGYPGAARAYDLYRVKTVPVPVDEEGMIVAEGRSLCDSARFAYVTPARQAPLGHTMSIRRRIELLQWAHERDALILEDDYDGEYRFGGYPSPSLQSLDPDGRVIYFGTFSKTLLPSFGIGYLVVPNRYRAVIAKLLDTLARPPSLEMQLSVAQFIESGAFDTHIRKMRLLYQQRQNALSSCLREHLGNRMGITVLNAGLHLVGTLPDGIDDRAVKAKAREKGLLPRPMSDFAQTYPQPPALMLGFADMLEREMPRAAQRLGEAIEACL
jgi:GntR family transcriptional regulator/MocR family aminotransferase